MGYVTLKACVDDLLATRQMVRIDQEVDPYLEAAEIHRRVFQAAGPAVYYARVKNCPFPMVSNLFGSMGRMRYIFRDSLDAVRRLVELKLDPGRLTTRPWETLASLPALLHMLPRHVARGPVLHETTSIERLPMLQSWPRDGGAFITLPVVYTEDAERPGWRHSNLGMYRVQLSGGQYASNREVGLHYQIHRGIGVHHAAAIRRGEPLKVNVFVGGAPAMTVAAVMPLPEGLPELTFAGVLGRHRIPLIRRDGGLPIYAEADFCITGTVDPARLLPEGPFGDHLGYYTAWRTISRCCESSRSIIGRDAIWPFTVVGRPPQEDTIFGAVDPRDRPGRPFRRVIPGLHAVHAVDAAGVHPLLAGHRQRALHPLRRAPASAGVA
jgi:4-hydroxy-3-polyprenylbenzoate decarboxylase